MKDTGETILKRLNKIEYFQEIIKKFTTNKKISYEEKSYILGIAILLIKYYEEDKRKRSYIEFAYYIILKYSTTYEDYQPLYDFSVEFGFFPIAKHIIENNLLDDLTIQDMIINSSMERFRYKDEYIQTLKQKDTQSSLLKNEFSEVAFIAPTSFGKSSIMVDLIRKYDSDTLKVGIIVPTKSLLMQTYKMIKKEIDNKRLLIHDDMYKDEASFIAIFTQERALRLLDQKVFFDFLFIDEAHNLFDRSSRSILLARVIRKNFFLNKSHKVVYLSPLIDNIENLKTNQIQDIAEQRIDFNLKEAEIFELRLNRKAYKYNRFVDEFYVLKGYGNYIEYIKNNAKNKNFIYLTNPKKIEEFAKNMVIKLPEIKDKNNEILELIEILTQNVHKDFYPIVLLDNGLLYIHGKMPDAIKEYLEYKFKNIDELRYIVANSVILEGINLPIDNLYIMSLSVLNPKKIVNLIGRVNRLNTIFKDGDKQLFKLLPSVHFVNSKDYGRKNKEMTPTIKKLRSSIFKDKVNNPTLEAFDLLELDRKIEKATKIKDKENAIKNKQRIENIRNYENFIYANSNGEFEELKKYCIEHSIHIYEQHGSIKNVYSNDIDTVVKIFLNKFRAIKDSDEWRKYTTMRKISWLFIENMNIDDFEFSRLANLPAQNFYEKYISFAKRQPLKDKINGMINSFHRHIKSGYKEIYLGDSYGEKKRYYEKYRRYSEKVYVDLSYKTDKELVNLAIVKIKLEDDFISFKLIKYVEMMYFYKLISENEYNLFVYGTEELKNIELIQHGLSFTLIARLEKDKQLDNIYFDDYGNLKGNEAFEEFKKMIDGFYRFQIDKFL